MTELDRSALRKRTAVVVVHGIGSQRAQDTVRGVIGAVWSDGPSAAGGKRLWTHPEPNGEDIDLAVVTTNKIPGASDRRSVDFHELYWAHVMSETKAVAVLLWLFELARKGPIMKPGMNGAWWAAAIFLCLLILSIALLALQGVLMFSRTNPDAMLVGPFLLILCCIAFGALVARRNRAMRLAWQLGKIFVTGLIIATVYLVIDGRFSVAADAATVALPLLAALLAIFLLMRAQGLRAFWRVLFLSTVMFIVALCFTWDADAPLGTNIYNGWRPWSLDSPWSSVLAWAVIGTYLAANAAFLQPYLGDAARYFRNSPANVAVRREIRKQAVETLDYLHASGRYDRIIVVAHSLGSVIAYDMLRAYFSRVHDELPPTAALGGSFTAIDGAPWQPKDDPSRDDLIALRSHARQTIRAIADATVNKPADERKYRSWLVTDFVTLGAALTHAHFLMCQGDTLTALEEDFARRVDERDFPTCPPKRLDGDGLLSFDDGHTRRFHHAAVFGLTRWTNIYFPLEEMLWGDAIGGPLAPLFGAHVLDVPTATEKDGKAGFFTHTAYWDVTRTEGRAAPHIVALRQAIDLADTGTATELITDPPRKA